MSSSDEKISTKNGKGIVCGAGGGIRTHEGLRQRILSPPPLVDFSLTWLGDPRINIKFCIVECKF